MNLMPPETLERVEQAEATSRIVVVGAVSLSLLAAAWLHGGLRLSDAEARRALAERRAQEVLVTEQESARLTAELDGLAAEISAWRSVQLPFLVSSLLATISNELPTSVTCDVIEFDASSLVGAAVRSGDGKTLVAPPARLRGEMAGIALSDLDVAMLVDALRAREPISSVGVETTRHQRIDNRSVRAFRISFEIDLDHLQPTMPMAVATGGQS
jgi:hypothetical protein